MMHRRSFLAAGVGLLVAGSRGRAAEGGKRIAFLGTEISRHSHAQHFLDRLTQGYTWKGRWQKPRVEVAAVYLDQFPQGDLGRRRIGRHKLRQCSSITEALTLRGLCHQLIRIAGRANIDPSWNSPAHHQRTG